MTTFVKTPYRGILVRDDSFSYRSVVYRLGDVSHLYLRSVRSSVTLYFLPIEVAERTKLRISFADGRIIRLRKSRLAKRRPGPEGNLVDLYAFLASRTFSQRIAPFDRQLAERGFFEYDNCRFYPRSRIVIRGREFPIEDSHFLKSYGFIEARLQRPYFHDKVRHFLDGVVPQLGFRTLWDTDVIFSLLERDFGLTWDTA